MRSLARIKGVREMYGIGEVLKGQKKLCFKVEAVKQLIFQEAKDKH